MGLLKLNKDLEKQRSKTLLSSLFPLVFYFSEKIQQLVYQMRTYYKVRQLKAKGYDSDFIGPRKKTENHV